jgi:hypothetical protein
MLIQLRPFRAGPFAPVALFRLLVLAVAVALSPVAALAQNAPATTTFAFEGRDSTNSYVVHGWVSFPVDLLVQTLDPDGSKATYSYDVVDPEAAPVAALGIVITDPTGGTQLITNAPLRQLELICENAAESTFTVRASNHGQVYTFTVTGELGSLFTGLALPTSAPTRGVGSWLVFTHRRETFHGDRLVFVDDADVTTLLAQIEALGTQVTSLTADVQRLQSEADTTALELSHKVAELHQATREIRNLTAGLTAAQTELIAARQEVAALTESLAGLEARNVTLVTENAALKASERNQTVALARITAAIAKAAKDASFQIPGLTAGEKMASLAAAIENLNPGQLKTLHSDITGAKK